jgi:hypothetical protein
MGLDVHSEIHALITAWAAAWQDRTASRLINLWDRADTDSWYLPAGRVEPVIGNSVVGHLQRKCLNIPGVTYRPTSPHVRELTADLGLAFFELEWSELIVAPHAEAPECIGGRVRVTLLARKRDAVWRIFHYAEAPLAPLLELQAYYEAVAADGLEAMPVRPWTGGANP